MHPRQASLLTQANEITERLAADKSGQQALLWKYTDPAGHVFYLDEKILTSLRSPFTGKAFTPKRPVRYTPAQVGKALKEEMAKGDEAPAAPKTEKEAFWKD
jgi:hypothetical protein